MQEIFQNVRQEVKDTAETSWNIALIQDNPMKAAEFLDNVIRFFSNRYTEEEIEFLQFYFQIKMEMMKE